jgi:hypothetical protein
MFVRRSFASTQREICEQIKDPKRNGGKSLEEFVHHMAEDSLVGWGGTLVLVESLCQARRRSLAL